LEINRLGYRDPAIKDEKPLLSAMVSRLPRDHADDPVGWSRFSDIADWHTDQ